MDDEPRWLDPEACARYISVRTDALPRLVRAGRIAALNDLRGPRQPQWDRLELDRMMEADTASESIDQAVEKIAENILRGESKSRLPSRG